MTFTNDPKNPPFGLFSAAFWRITRYVCGFSDHKRERISDLYALACARSEMVGIYDCIPSWLNFSGLLLRYWSRFAMSHSYVLRKLVWVYHAMMRCNDKRTDDARGSYGSRYNASCWISWSNIVCGVLANTVCCKRVTREKSRKARILKTKNPRFTEVRRFLCFLTVNQNVRMQILIYQCCP